MKEKLKTCPVCGHQMATNAVVCPSCGAKNKKPIYKRWWFWVVVVLVVAGGAGSAGGGKGEDAQQSPSTSQAADTRALSDAAAAGVADAADGAEGMDATNAVEPIEPIEPAEPPLSYMACTVSEMMETLNSNALKAKNTYLDQYIEVTGRLSNIDSNGSYIDIMPSDDEFAFIGVQCYLQTEEQEQQVMELSVGDTITVQGKVTAVGEILGYSLDIDNFVV